MTSMPIIDDRMVVELRRTGRRPASYARAASSRRTSVRTRVVLQQYNPCIGKHDVPCDVCPFPGMWCCDGFPKFGPC
jgi:hypothetical protein